jgi:hypothetical protein
MSAKTKFTIINLLGLACVLLFFFNARQVVVFPVGNMEFGASPGLLVLLAYVIGVVIGGISMIPFVGSKQEENVAKLKEWQNQDAKLAIEVQSDKEKQLEAKIATLEAALKAALKK